MEPIFPSKEWVDNFVELLNADKKYASVARNWEGSILFEINADGPLEETTLIFMDLWHGKCREGKILSSEDESIADFILSASFKNFVKILQGKLDPLQAMVTQKLSVTGKMSYIMRNVPTVLDFVRCAKNSTVEVLGG